MTEAANLLKTLQLQAGTRVVLINVPQEIAHGITAGAEVEPVHLSDDFDAVVAFCRTAIEAEAFVGQVVDKLPEDGVLWLAMPKGDEALADGAGAGALASAGWLAGEHTELEGSWAAVRFSRA